MLSVGTLMVSGCISNLEPEGIADLRGAKAELLRAQTALQAAQAAKVEAEAALILAQAKVQEAIAKQEEAKALKLQYEAELAQAQNEAEIAAIQARIAEIEAQALVTAENLKADLLEAQAASAAAQALYEQALKDLAIAKHTLTPEQLAKIGALENAVATGRDAVEEKTVALETAAKYLAEVLAELEEPRSMALAYKMAERAIVVAQAELEAIQKVEAKVKAYLELDPEVVAWDAQLEAINAELEALWTEFHKKEAAQAEATAVLMDSLEIITELADLYTSYTGYELLETGYFSKVYDGYLVDEYFEVPEIVVNAPVDENGESIVPDFVLKDEYYYYGEEDELLEEFDDAIEYLNTNYSEEFIEAVKSVYEAYVAEAKDNVYGKQMVAQYNDAVAAYKAGNVVPYAKKYYWNAETDVDALVKEYNEAVKVFNAAVATYESEEAKFAGPEYEEYEALLQIYNKAVSAADGVRAKAYQTAHTARVAAEVKYQKAYSVYVNAVNNYYAVIEAAERAAGVSYSTMLAEIAAYEAVDGVGYDEEQVKTIKAYQAYVKTIVAAEYDTADPDDKDAQSVYDAACQEYVAADDAYDKAKNDADYAYSVAENKAYNEYDNAIRELNATEGQFNVTYANYLQDAIYDAKTDVQDIATELANLVSSVSGVSYTSFEYYYGADDAYSVYFYLPEFAVEDVLDANNQLSVSIAEVAVADLLNVNEFLEEIVDLVDQITSVEVWYDVDYYYLRNYDGYPFELPTEEEYDEYYKGIREDYPYEYLVTSSVYSYKYYEDEVEEIDEFVAVLPLFAEYAKAIEAAKAEFEALVAENAAEVEAMKAEVEAFMPKFNEIVEAYQAEMDELMAKVQLLDREYYILADIIDSYTDGCETVEEFVAELNEYYEEVLEAVYWAEDDVVIAEMALEELKAGLVSAAEYAQRAYDRAAAELAEAIAKLDRAAAELEAVLAAIYNDQPVEETPAE